jgi:predicted flap endonuclease-1-like 5' DNA nuclease
MAEFVELPVLVPVAIGGGEPQYRSDTRLVNPAHVAAILPEAQTCTIMIAGKDWRIDMPARDLAAALSSDDEVVASGRGETPLSAVKGIGDKTEALLMSVGIGSVEELAAVPGDADVAKLESVFRFRGAGDAARRAGQVIVENRLVLKAQAHLAKEDTGLLARAKVMFSGKG